MAKNKQERIAEQEPRISAIGMCLRAKDYLFVAQAAHTAAPHGQSFAVIHNLELAMEIAMKAFIFSQRPSLLTIEALGHRMPDIMRACEEAGIKEICGWSFDDYDRALFNWFGDVGEGQRLRYFISRTETVPYRVSPRLPDPCGDMIERAHQLIEAVEPTCYEAYKLSKG